MTTGETATGEVYYTGPRTLAEQGVVIDDPAVALSGITKIREVTTPGSEVAVDDDLVCTD